MKRPPPDNCPMCGAFLRRVPDQDDPTGRTCRTCGTWVDVRKKKEPTAD